MICKELFVLRLVDKIHAISGFAQNYQSALTRNSVRKNIVDNNNNDINDNNDSK